MSLSNEAIQEFKRIYRKEFGDDTSDQEAQEMAENLLSAFRVICQPIPEGKQHSMDEEHESL